MVINYQTGRDGEEPDCPALVSRWQTAGLYVVKYVKFKQPFHLEQGLKMHFSSTANGDFTTFISFLTKKMNLLEESLNLH